MFAVQLTISILSSHHAECPPTPKTETLSTLYWDLYRQCCETHSKVLYSISSLFYWNFVVPGIGVSQQLKMQFCIQLSEIIII